MLCVKDLTKIYDDRVAVDDISFELEDNKVYGFLGPNGAGKSTTLNMITGYISPTFGNVRISDTSLMLEPTKFKTKIGYLPEIPPLYPDLTVLEFLDFAANIKGFKKKEERALEISRVSKLTNLEEVMYETIKVLSKGFKQRVGIAMALIGKPEVIILDEPTVGLDPRQIVEVRKLVRDLGKSHIVIISSHILSEINAMCDELLIISKGKLLAHDTAENLVNAFNDTQKFTLVVKGSSSSAEKVLDRIDNIEEKRILKEDELSTTINVTAKKGIDIREEVSEKCLEEGLTILELNVHYVSLEDVYLRLTREENRIESNI